MRRIEFTVFGKPQTRGSKTAIPLRKRDGSLLTRPNGSPVIAMSDANKRSKDWMAAVSAEAADAMTGDLIRGPVRMTAEFFFPRPQTHYGSGKNAGVVKASAPRRCGQGGDLDKLCRGICDALSEVIYADDKQVCELRASKAWTEGSARAVVLIEEVEMVLEKAAATNERELF